jgi:hypothetical protein
MFRSKRVSVQPGDVFLETLGREKKLPLLRGELPAACQDPTDNRWVVSTLTTFNDLPHARLTNEATGRVRTLSIDALELQEIYKKAK